jgi:hypothetical protein
MKPQKLINWINKITNWKTFGIIISLTKRIKINLISRINKKKMTYF